MRIITEEGLSISSLDLSSFSQGAICEKSVILFCLYSSGLDEVGLKRLEILFKEILALEDKEILLTIFPGGSGPPETGEKQADIWGSGPPETGEKQADIWGSGPPETGKVASPEEGENRADIIPDTVHNLGPLIQKLKIPMLYLGLLPRSSWGLAMDDFLKWQMSRKWPNRRRVD